MTSENKTIFTRRITQGNRSDIIVVLFDIYFACEQDARKALEEKEYDDMTGAIRRMEMVVDHLTEALNFDYEISANLYALYDFVKRQLAAVVFRPRSDELENASEVMSGLREAFVEVAAQDNDARSMENAQTVRAGMTYGRSDLTETVDADYENRGFLA